MGRVEWTNIVWRKGRENKKKSLPLTFNLINWTPIDLSHPLSGVVCIGKVVKTNTSTRLVWMPWAWRLAPDHRRIRFYVYLPLYSRSDRFQVCTYITSTMAGKHIQDQKNQNNFLNFSSTRFAGWQRVYKLVFAFHQTPGIWFLLKVIAFLNTSNVIKKIFLKTTVLFFFLFTAHPTFYVKFKKD